MKMLVIFFGILAVAACDPVVKTWTYTQLHDAIVANSEPDLKSYLEDALHQIALAALAKNTLRYQAVIPSPSGANKWTKDELKNAALDPDTKQEYKHAILDAHSNIEAKNAAGEKVDSIEVLIPGIDVSVWTPEDLNKALTNSATSTELIPYLEKARDELNASIIAGTPKKTIAIATPVGVIPHEPTKHVIKKTKPAA